MRGGGRRGRRHPCAFKVHSLQARRAQWRALAATACVRDMRAAGPGCATVRAGDDGTCARGMRGTRILPDMVSAGAATPTCARDARAAD
eukprot:4382472-Pleurochrysis_carterae.AAC.1